MSHEMYANFSFSSLLYCFVGCYVSFVVVDESKNFSLSLSTTSTNDDEVRMG